MEIIFLGILEMFLHCLLVSDAAVKKCEAILIAKTLNETCFALWEVLGYFLYHQRSEILWYCALGYMSKGLTKPFLLPLMKMASC